MLKILKELRGGLSASQQEMFRNAFPEELVKQFFDSDDEKSATKAATEINRYLGARPMVAITLYRKLLPEQRALISDMAFDDEE